MARVKAAPLCLNRATFAISPPLAKQERIPLSGLSFGVKSELVTVQHITKYNLKFYKH